MGNAVASETVTRDAGSVLAHIRAKGDDGTVEFVASTEQMASDGLVIRREAWAPYLDGGELSAEVIPFTASHETSPPGQAVPAIGVVVKRFWEEGTGLVIRVKFVGDDVNPQGPRWHKAYTMDPPALTDVSVSWRGTKFSRKDGEDNHVVGLKWREVAGVLDGADDGAKKRAAACGIEAVVHGDISVSTASTTNVQAPAAPESLTSAAGDISERAIGAAEVVARARRTASATGTLSRAFSQYLGHEDLFTPSGPATLEPKLGGAAYRLVYTMSGVGFLRVDPKTDELYHFRGSAMEQVLREIDEFWGVAEDYAKLGLLHHRGILLEGPPGSGKSSLLRQTTEMMVAQGDVVFIADSVWNLSEALVAFRKIEPTRRLVVVMEDMDSHVGGDSERELLSILDGERSISGVLYLATTNYVESFPPRMIRPGRFDRVVHVGYPSIEGRLAYLTHKLGKVEKQVEIARLAGETDGLSFGDLRELVISVYALKEPVATVLARLAKRRGSARAAAPETQAVLRVGSGDGAAREDEDKIGREILAACGRIESKCDEVRAAIARMEEYEAKEMSATAKAARPATPGAARNQVARNDGLSAALADLQAKAAEATAALSVGRAGRS